MIFLMCINTETAGWFQPLPVSKNHTQITHRSCELYPSGEYVQIFQVGERQESVFVDAVYFIRLQVPEKKQLFRL